MKNQILSFVPVVGFVLATAFNSPAQPHQPVTRDQVKVWQANFVPQDPWRFYAGSTNYWGGTRGFQFEGVVQSVSPGEIGLLGWVAAPLSYAYSSNIKIPTYQFVLQGYPRSVRVGQLLSRNDRLIGIAWDSRLKVLKYGTVCAPRGSAPKPATTNAPVAAK